MEKLWNKEKYEELIEKAKKEVDKYDIGSGMYDKRLADLRHWERQLKKVEELIKNKKYCETCKGYGLKHSHHTL